MRKWLELANGLNPQFRPICGFQPVYEADADMMNTILQEVPTADYFDILYTSPDVEIYSFCVLRKDGFIRFHDIRFIASRVGQEKWLIIAGLIAVNRDSQLDYQIKAAKKKLIKAINRKWHLDIRLKKTA